MNDFGKYRKIKLQGLAYHLIYVLIRREMKLLGKEVRHAKTAQSDLGS